MFINIINVYHNFHHENCGFMMFYGFMGYAQVDKPRLHTLTVTDLFTCGQWFISCFQWFPICSASDLSPLVSCTSSHTQLWLKLLLRNLPADFEGKRRDLGTSWGPADWASGSHLLKAPASVVKHGQPIVWTDWPTAGGYTL